MLRLKLSSFRCALSGIIFLLRTQPHARWHLLFSLLALFLGFLLKLAPLEWVVILIMMALVWTAEALNTALEQACDAITLEQNPSIGRAKDVAAGAVLLAAVFAVVVGTVIFLPKLITWFKTVW